MKWTLPLIAALLLSAGLYANDTASVYVNAGSVTGARQAPQNMALQKTIAQMVHPVKVGGAVIGIVFALILGVLFIKHVQRRRREKIALGRR